MELGQAIDHVRDPSGLVATATVRHGREQRRVGLDEQAFERKSGGDLAQLRGVLEGQDSGERDVEPARDALACERCVTREAVDHAAGTLGAFVVEDREDLVEGVARLAARADVDHEGAIGLRARSGSVRAAP